ncbi:hypothetical protein C1Y40_02102 [Mycobacterium talmoniae]|uniref:Uncharacterized protein n=1 Tax=Mycobacterium talmoniae TaxID=1858794 RepID=A0A2S8BLW9_9MYCO|nr:hypothetical protein C1Y40_02102 [Mycobacterium talmoniae]
MAVGSEWVNPKVSCPAEMIAKPVAIIALGPNRSSSTPAGIWVAA